MNKTRNNCEFGAGVCRKDECPCDIWADRTEERKMLAELLSLCDHELTNWEVNKIEEFSHVAALGDYERNAIRRIYERISR